MKRIAVIALSAMILFSGCGTDKKADPDKLLKHGNFEAAAEEYILLLDKNEKDFDSYKGLAEAYVGMNEYEAAVDILCEGYGITKKEELVERMKKITSTVYKTASDKIQWQTVIYCCERALECSEDEEFYEIIAISYIRMNQYDKAADTVADGVSELGKTGFVKRVASELYTIASKAYSDGNKEEAKELFEYVKEIDPDNKNASDMLDVINGAVEKETEEKPEVVETVEETVESQPVTPEPEVAKIPEPVYETKSYTVQIGVYGELENAEKKVASANAKGLSASYFVSGGKYHVTVGTYSTESEANAAASQAIAAGFSAVII